MCEDCIKRDVCKYKKEIDHWVKEGFFYGNKNVPKPLKVDIYCELKVAEVKPGANWGTDSTYVYPEYWTNTTSSDIDYQTATCN